MDVIGISFEDFKVIVADVYKFPEICGEFSDESSDFIDRLRYVWHSKTAYSWVCVEYDTMTTHGKQWVVTRSKRNFEKPANFGCGDYLSEAVNMANQ